MTDKNNKKTDGKETIQRKINPLVLVSQLGYNMISPIVAGIAAGYFLDKWLDCQPWGLIFMTVMGIGAAYKNAFTTFGRYMKKGDEGEDGEDEK